MSGRDVEIVQVGDLSERAAVRRALCDTDTVIHLAARVHVMRDAAADPWAEFRRTNVEGTRILLEEGISAGIRAFVFVSSVKAVGEATDTPWTEESPPKPVDPYGISKLEAERLVRELGDAHGLHAPVLRLPLVYGPGVKANMLRLFELVDRGIPLPLGGIANRRSLVYVDNFIGAIDAVLSTPAAGRETFFVSDGHDLSTPELIRAIGYALGRPARLVSVPPVLFRAAGRAGDRISRYLPFPVTTPAVDRLLGSLTIDAAKLSQVTGFKVPVAVEEGLQRTAQWFHTRRAVKL